MYESSFSELYIICIIPVLIISTVITHYMPGENFRDVFLLKDKVFDKDKAGCILRNYNQSGNALMAIASVVYVKFDNINLLFFIIVPGVAIIYFGFRKYFKDTCCK